MDLQERSVHLCFSFVLTDFLCLYVHNTPWQSSASLRKSVVDSEKCLLTGGGELEPQRCPVPAAGTCQESLGSSTSSHPHSNAHSHSTSSATLLSRPQFRALDMKLSYHDSASSVCRDSQPCETSPAPCPACLVISSPTKQGLQPLREGDICLALLSLAPCPASCSPASRESHWKEMLKLVSCSPSQFIPQTRHFPLLLLPLS